MYICNCNGKSGDWVKGDVIQIFERQREREREREREIEMGKMIKQKTEKLFLVLECAQNF
jgi:hypothetical protein